MKLSSQIRLKSSQQAVTTITSRWSPQWKFLFRSDGIEKLRNVGLEDSLIAEAFFEDYLAKWKSDGVDKSHHAGTNTTEATDFLLLLTKVVVILNMVNVRL